ncbi:hypothetical protein ACFQUU_21050 [Herbaspirillum sp. GCM10030257]|uniref:hypothetical protein n=1 Tax=Herbaspirillum sp. GCM10030257 TaxID=3273393 RepID=UPI003622D368
MSAPEQLHSPKFHGNDRFMQGSCNGTPAHRFHLQHSYLNEAKGNESSFKKLAHEPVHCYANDRSSVLYSPKIMRADAQFGNFKLIVAAMMARGCSSFFYSEKLFGSFVFIRKVHVLNFLNRY